MQLFHFFLFFSFFSSAFSIVLRDTFRVRGCILIVSRSPSQHFASESIRFCFFPLFTSQQCLIFWFGKFCFFFFSFLRYLILVTFRFYDNFFDDTFSLNRRYYSYIGGVDSKKKSWLWRASLLHQGSFEYTFEVFPLLLTILTILRYNGRCFRN